MIDAKTIEELRGLAEKATPGPWETHLVDDTTIISPTREVATTCDSTQTEREDGYNIEYEQMGADAALIVAMRNALPALLDALSASIARVSEGERVHASDCAIYNAPALPPGPCDCGATASLALTAENEALRREHGDERRWRIQLEADCKDYRTRAESLERDLAAAIKSVGVLERALEEARGCINQLARHSSEPEWVRGVLATIDTASRDHHATIAKDLADRGYSGDAIAAALRSRT